MATMKRTDALAQLSRDHHHGLVAAQRLTRATEETAAGARGAFLAFWREDGQEHFRVEEDVLLPACARHVPPTDDAVVRVLTDHVDLRRRAGDVASDETPAVEDLHALGERLHAHIRHEERVLFPRIEDAMSDDELVALAAAVDAAHTGGASGGRAAPVDPKK
jgi:hemerythrin-like domain-containing protein